MARTGSSGRKTLGTKAAASVTNRSTAARLTPRADVAPPSARRPEVSDGEAQRIARGLVGAQAPRDGRERPQERRLYFARRPLGYAGQPFDREQQVQLVGLLNDAKLVDLKYLAPWPAEQRGFPCRHCPARFLSLSALTAHGDKRHAPPPAAPVMEPRQPGESPQEFEDRERAFLMSVQGAEDAILDQEERRLDAIAPLDLTMTTASRMG